MRRAPRAQLEEMHDRARMTKPEAFGQTHAMFVEHALNLLPGPGGFFHYSLIGAEDFAPLPRLLVRLPDQRREPGEVDARDLDRIHPVVGAILFADLACPVTIEDLHFAAPGTQPLGHRKGVPARF